jgi:hypothetical protein
MEKTRTVKDLKNQVCDEVGASREQGMGHLSREHQMFWRKLNDIGGRNIATHLPEEYQDIDETVELSSDEYALLLAEFRRMQRAVKG